jgi:hypothetical protein
VPYSLTTNDSKFGRGVFGSGEDFFAFLRDSFDLLYEEGLERPRRMSVGLHMRLTGHPGRAKALIRFIRYIRGHPRVWIAAARTSPGTGSIAFRRPTRGYFSGTKPSVRVRMKAMTSSISSSDNAGLSPGRPPKGGSTSTLAR